MNAVVTAKTENALQKLSVEDSSRIRTEGVDAPAQTAGKLIK